MTATANLDETVLYPGNVDTPTHTPHALAIRIEGKARCQRARELCRLLLEMADHLSTENDAPDSAADSDGVEFVYHVIVQPTSH